MQNYLKTRLFNTNADRTDAAKWIRNPNQKGDFMCKAAHTLLQKQFIILNNKYWKFLIYNNPSFKIKNFAEFCLDIAFDFKFCDLLILMAIISQKQTLATAASLEVVEIILWKTWKLYHSPTPSPPLDG